MFTRYWRTYPVGLQMFLLIAMLFTMASLGVAIASFISITITGVDGKTAAEVSSKSSIVVIKGARILQLIVNLFTFSGTALLFANLTHPKPFTYLGLRRPKNTFNIIISIILILSVVPLGQQLEYYVKMVDLGPAIKASQLKMDETYKAILNMQTPAELIMCLLIMGVVAPVGEELLFRGIIMRFAYRATHRVLASAIVSGIFFAIFHGQVYAFIPIMLAGMLLSYIYYYNGSIWVNMITHCIYNSVQVFIIYMATHNIIVSGADINNLDHYPWYLVLPAALIFVVCFYLLWKNRTPLPPDWANDFSKEEMTEKISKDFDV